MGKITIMREGEYRLLVLAVDKARSVLAIAETDVEKSKSMKTGITAWEAKDAFHDAQYKLEIHVGKYGLPKLGLRV